MSKLTLSVLDQSTVVSGRSPDDAIRESIALAQHCEALGYHRYWLAEHHASASQAGTAPEILIAAIAATTRRIRVGSAGVMLPHYSSLKVAEQFRVLEAIAPGRIDLGLGRAPGSDGLTAHALNPNAAGAADHFPAQVRDVLAWSAGERLVEGHPFRDIVAQPAGPHVPEVWILGSSSYGAQVAATYTGTTTAQVSATRPHTRRWLSGHLPPTRPTRPSAYLPPARSGGSAGTAAATQRCQRSRRPLPTPIRTANGLGLHKFGLARSAARATRSWPSSKRWLAALGRQKSP